MHKKDLIKGLTKFVETYDVAAANYGNQRYEVRWNGQKAFASFLIHYFENLQIPHDEKYDFWTIEHHLPELMVDAFEQLRTGTDDATVRLRQAYEAETGYEVPNITDLGASNIFDQQSAVQTTLGFMLKELTGRDWVEKKIDTYCNAQKYVLQQTFDKFLRLVYRKGLGEMANKCDKRGMSGKFGETELRTFIMAGRIMFTFARRKEGKTSVYLRNKLVETLPYQEDSVSFVGEDGDTLCLSAGLQSVDTDLRTCLDMIEDTIKNWPATQQEQKKIYKADQDVSILQDLFLNTPATHWLTGFLTFHRES